MVPSLESPTLSLLSIGCCKDMQQCTRSGRFIQYSSRSAACRAHAPERRRVLLGLSSAAASASVPVLDSLAKEAQLERFLSAESGFLFEYPPGWTVAIVRSLRLGYAALLCQLLRIRSYDHDPSLDSISYSCLVLSDQCSESCMMLKSPALAHLADLVYRTDRQ